MGANSFHGGGGANAPFAPLKETLTCYNNVGVVRTNLVTAVFLDTYSTSSSGEFFPSQSNMLLEKVLSFVN